MVRRGVAEQDTALQVIDEITKAPLRIRFESKTS
jgi:hypothetical protein